MFQESRGDVASALFVNRGLKARQNVNPFTLSQSGSAVRRKFDRCGIMQNQLFCQTTAKNHDLKFWGHDFLCLFFKKLGVCFVDSMEMMYLCDMK